MNERFDVAVIGSGGLGLSTALHLALAGQSVVVLDRSDIGSQTSPRAAGLLSQAKHDAFEVGLSQESAKLLTSFATWTGGVALTVHQAGSLKVARTREMATVARHEMACGRRADIAVEMVSPEEARSLAPYFQFSDDVAMITYTPSDLYLDPRELVDAYIEACDLHGVDLRPHTSVLGLRQRQGEVQYVETSRGILEVGAVVDAAGGWVDIVAERLGFRIPVIPVRHQLCVTEPAGMTNDQAAVRIIECNIYMRPDRGGLMFGGYEPVPQEIDMRATDESWDVRDLQLDFEPLRKLIDELGGQVPVLRKPHIRELRGGIPTMTADGGYVMDKAPCAHNVYVVGGCNVAGLTASPAIGRAVARLVTDGDAGIDLSGVRLSRFDGRSYDDLRAEAVRQYSARYSVQPRRDAVT